MSFGHISSSYLNSIPVHLNRIVAISILHSSICIQYLFITVVYIFVSILHYYICIV